MADELISMGLTRDESKQACEKLENIIEVPWRSEKIFNINTALPLWKVLQRVMVRHSLKPLARRNK